MHVVEEISGRNGLRQRAEVVDDEVPLGGQPLYDRVALGKLYAPRLVVTVARSVERPPGTLR